MAPPDAGAEDDPGNVLSGPDETRVERALDLAARWLVGYGILSLVLAALVLLGTVVIAARLDSSTDRLLERVQRIGVTLLTTAAALDQGVSSAERFETTLDGLAPTLERTTAALRSGSQTLTELATATDRISLLGQRPFAGLTASLTDTAGDLDALATSLDGNAATLDDAKAAIARMGTTLPPVAQNLRALQTNLEADVGGVLDDVRTLVPLAGVLFVLWLGVPGAGAFVLGSRIRRALRG